MRSVDGRRRRGRKPFLVTIGLVLAAFAAIFSLGRIIAPAASLVPVQIIVPAGLPNHFSFGITNGPGGVQYLNAMRANNGTAWDYRYQYLSGGADIGHGWANWGANGSFATNYIHINQQNNYRSEFVYYMLLQTSGPTGKDERTTDMAKLANPSTMSALYADWALLMHAIGVTNDPAVVIIEPDLWGYIEQTSILGGTNDPASVPASVANSGYTDAQGFPNNAQGFAWALLHMRDLYAPHALLALHISCWGTLDDVTTNASANFDAVGVGRKAGQFANRLLTGEPAGVSSFDLLSNDIAGDDAGLSGRWWDRYNQTFPNYARYLVYIRSLSNTTSKGIILWQVPIGNQYFTTENNSPGHYQDNKAEYILSHIADFANAGIIGAQFGPPGDSTNIYDAKSDGITNPLPIQSYECNYCNTHTSSYADDDGGYLRIFVGQYYRSGALTVNGLTISAPPAASVPAPSHGPAATPTPPAAPLTPTPVAIAVPHNLVGIAPIGKTALSSPVHKANGSASPHASGSGIAVILVLLGVLSFGLAIFLVRRRQVSVTNMRQSTPSLWERLRQVDLALIPRRFLAFCADLVRVAAEIRR